MDDAQREVVEFLRDPASYPPRPDPSALAAAGEEGFDGGPVEVIETHASIVFLVGSLAYKLKRAVHYPYLDFSTLAKRRAACTAELRLNRRTAPQLYLEILAISRLPDGSIGWGRPTGGEAGEPLDFVVMMRRFGQDQLLDSLAQAGGLSAPLLYRLTAHIAAFHDQAEKRRDHGGATAMAGLLAENLQILRQHRAAGFDEGRLGHIETAMQQALTQLGGLLDERRAAGKVRRCHGDLHLRNICLVDGEPVLFDCLEFSEKLASIDVLYDLAFLLMDLNHRGERGFANLVMNRYLDLTGEDDGMALLPPFLALRSLIRAHVTATMAAHGWSAGPPDSAFAEARRYLAAAEAALTPQPPRLVAVGGLSGSGKSSLATRLAGELGGPPGARLLRSDVLRKLRFGAEPETPLPPQAYAEDVTEQVYRDLCDRAAAALRAGCAAVIDAVALRENERRAFAGVAAAAGVPFTGLWLDAPPATLAIRLATRRDDASDATLAVLERQREIDPGRLDWRRIDAGGAPEATLMTARRALLH